MLLTTLGNANDIEVRYAKKFLFAAQVWIFGFPTWISELLEKGLFGREVGKHVAGGLFYHFPGELGDHNLNSMGELG